MNQQIPNVVSDLITSRVIPRREPELAKVPWERFQFTVGERIKLRPVDSRSRVYPDFMEDKVFIVAKVKPKDICPKCNCDSNNDDPNYHFTDCPCFYTHSQRIFLRYLGNHRYVVERDQAGHIVNGRFDAGDFVLVLDN